MAGTAPFSFLTFPSTTLPPPLPTTSLIPIVTFTRAPLTPASRYQSFVEGRYPLPNDEAEQNREEMKHAMVKELLGESLILAPIGDSPQKILDLGTGCGVWAIEGESRLLSPYLPHIFSRPILPVPYPSYPLYTLFLCPFVSYHTSTITFSTPFKQSRT